MNRNWFLEGTLGPGKNWLISVDQPQFLVGRDNSSNLCLASPDVSRTHARLSVVGNGLWLEDLHSKNGTYVNKTKLTDRKQLYHGDIIHFATMEFRVGNHAAQPEDSFQLPGEGDETGIWTSEELSHCFTSREKEFRRMLDTGAVRVIFEPIVDLATENVVAYEALGRSNFPGLPASPSELFKIACSLGLEGQLSEVLFFKALEDAARLIPGERLFINLHPATTNTPYLQNLIERVVPYARHQEIVFEVSEEAVTDLDMIEDLHRNLKAHGMYLAYDDFGAGQARLLELMKVPPDYLKFDLRFIHHIENQAASFHQTLAVLVQLAADLGTTTLAEGIETEAEKETCRSLGFALAQGYLYGHLVRGDLPRSGLQNNK